MKKIAVLVFQIIFTFIICSIVSAASDDSQNNKINGAVSRQERIFGLVKIYSQAKQHFAYFERVPELDWDQTFKDYLPLVEKEQNLLEYYRTLQRFIALLKDGHTNLCLPQSIRNQMDNLPITLEYIENQWVVTKRQPTEEILVEDIPPGTVVLEIEGAETNDYIQNKIFPYIAEGTIQGKRAGINRWSEFFLKDLDVKVKLRYPDGKLKTRIIKANRQSMKWNDELRKKYTSSLNLSYDFGTNKLDGDILYVRYPKCTAEIEKKFCKLVQDMQPQPQAMIIDLRGNGGGNTPQQAVEHLISSPIPSNLFKTRWSISYIDAQMSYKDNAADRKAVFDDKKSFMKLPENMNLDWFVVTDDKTQLSPADNNYRGKLILLIDCGTGSAAEDMVVLLHAPGRAKIIGEPSAGSTGQPLGFDLPGGGSARICTANAKYPDGREFVGIGIQPDILVNRTIKDIIEGQDTILQTAINYLRKNQ